MVCRDSLDIKSDRVKIPFTSALFDWLKPLTNAGEEETRVPRENLWRPAIENARYWGPKIQAPSKTQTRSLALVAGAC